MVDPRYHIILSEIESRTNGDFNKFTLTDHIQYKCIMVELKRELMDFLNNYWSVLEYWDNLDIDEVIKEYKEPDLKRLHQLQTYYNPDRAAEVLRNFCDVKVPIASL